MRQGIHRMLQRLRSLIRSDNSSATISGGFNHVRQRRRALFRLLGNAQKAGNLLLPVNHVGECLKNKHAAIFLKHDIHGLNLKGLVEFASEESQMGIHGTYFFMAPNHPDTLPYYNFSEQATAMVRIQGLGHEVGLHLDPYFLMQHQKQTLNQVMDFCLSAFRDLGLNVQSMNMHGNTGHKHRDKNGYGTSFELFEEIARQPDFPILEAMHADSAEMVRQNRIRLKDYGISYWADMPIWTAEYGYVVTNFISDNGLGKSGQYELLTHEETANQYAISRYQPPGARNRTQPDSLVTCGGKTSLDRFGNWKLAFESAEFESLFDTKPFVLQPAQILLHPQFYCD